MIADECYEYVSQSCNGQPKISKARATQLRIGASFC